MEKAYLVNYQGICSSTIINGIKFTDKNRIAPVTEEVAKLFMDASGKSMYDDIVLTKIEKAEIVPDAKKVIYTVDGLKRDNTLAQLQEMARGLELSDIGSKTELAERIVSYFSNLEDDGSGNEE